MDLQITITLSDKLFELLEDKLPNLGRRVESALTKELGRKLRSESEISVTAMSSGGVPCCEAAKEEKPKRRRKPRKKAPDTPVCDPEQTEKTIKTH